MGMGIDDFLMSMPRDFGSYLYSLEGRVDYAEMSPEVYPHLPGRDPLDLDVNDLDWSAMNWSSVHDPAGQARPDPEISGQASFKADMNQLNSSGLGFDTWSPGR
jgi:hypothetical protein